MYTALAAVYDLFYEDDAERRADVYAAHLPKGEGADIGCGTGTLTLALYRRGYRIYGADPSEDMLRCAVQNAAAAGADVRFLCADAQDAFTAHPLDFVLAANDVVNYLPRLEKAFANVFCSLKCGGVFAFDISSAYKLAHVLAGNTFSQTENDVTYIWQNTRRANKLFIDFTVFSPSGATYIKTCETQTQYIRSQAEIGDALQNVGFTAIECYAFGKKSRPKETTERILFVAKKK